MISYRKKPKLLIFITPITLLNSNNSAEKDLTKYVILIGTNETWQNLQIRKCVMCVSSKKHIYEIYLEAKFDQLGIKKVLNYATMITCRQD